MGEANPTHPISQYFHGIHYLIFNSLSFLCPTSPMFVLNKVYHNIVLNYSPQDLSYILYCYIFHTVELSSSWFQAIAANYVYKNLSHNYF